jgi:carbonic anhydrase
VNEDILGSMEFGCKVAGAKFIMVLGHTKCGAIKGACDHVEMGNLTTLLNKISDAVEIEKETIENRNSNNSIFVENVAANNVRLVVKKIMDDSPILKELISSGNIGIAGGIHDISTGVVTLFNDTVIVH